MGICPLYQSDKGWKRLDLKTLKIKDSAKINMRYLYFLERRIKMEEYIVNDLTIFLIMLTGALSWQLGLWTVEYIDERRKKDGNKK